MTTQQAIDLGKVQAFMGKVMGDNAGAAATVMTSIGDRLGLFYEHLLVPMYLAAMPEVQAKLERGADMADIGSSRCRAKEESMSNNISRRGDAARTVTRRVRMAWFEHGTSRIYYEAQGTGDPVLVLQSLFDALSPPGLQWYWKTDFFTELSDKAIELHLKYAAHLPTMLSTMHLYPINGAVHHVGTSDTAFSFREANFAEVILGVDPDPANNERMIGWARDYWMALHPYSAGGGYVNMKMDEGTDNVKAAYRDNYARLAQIKAQYDPSNLFQVNQNIKPTR